MAMGERKMESSKQRTRKVSPTPPKKKAPADKGANLDYKAELQLLTDDELVSLAQKVSEEMEKREKNGEG
jgi:hypothetical protein